jgi:predicted membrane metal-binding protein
MQMIGICSDIRLYSLSLALSRSLSIFLSLALYLSFSLSLSLSLSLAFSLLVHGYHLFQQIPWLESLTAPARSLRGALIFHYRILGFGAEVVGLSSRVGRYIF